LFVSHQFFLSITSLLPLLGTFARGLVSQARPGVSGKVAQVGENGFGLRSLLGNGGSGAVWDAVLWE
ncbi:MULTISPECIES: hypothetical protein, partial [unclassified Microcoleus]|uniref:hypothetical protein n=1 Tax=unclassified Microcoleus TaxID=2642155 RepID=UPI002FD2186A